jgi:transcriptional regulator with XRE-family HTH domain
MRIVCSIKLKIYGGMTMFHNILKQLRIANKYTQQELADKLNVTQRTIAFYEKGDRHPDFDTLITLATIFDCSVDYLLGRTPKPNETLTKPSVDEALVVVAEGSNVPRSMIKDYIEYLKSQNKKD